MLIFWDNFVSQQSDQTYLEILGETRQYLHCARKVGFYRFCKYQVTGRLFCAATEFGLAVSSALSVSLVVEMLAMFVLRLSALDRDGLCRVPGEPGLVRWLMPLRTDLGVSITPHRYSDLPLALPPSTISRSFYRTKSNSYSLSI